MLAYLLGGVVTCLYMAIALDIVRMVATWLDSEKEAASADMRAQMNGSAYAVLFVVWPPFALYMFWATVSGLAKAIATVALYILRGRR